MRPKLARIKKPEDRPCEDPIPCGPDPRPASRSMWWGCARCVSHQASSAHRRPGRGGRSSRVRAVFACVTVLLPCPLLPNFASFTKAPGAGSPPAVRRFAGPDPPSCLVDGGMFASKRAGLSIPGRVKGVQARIAASNFALAPGPRANGPRIGRSIPDRRYASTRSRQCCGVPAMLVAAISASLTARAAAFRSPCAQAAAIAAASVAKPCSPIRQL